MTGCPTAYFNPPRRLPFIPPEAPQGKRLISLAINESPFGCSPRAAEAAAERLKQPNRYPDPSSRKLRQAIGAVHGYDPERIVCGNGSEELLDVIGRMFARPGDEIAMAQSGFFQFAVVAARVGADLKRLPEREGFVLDTEAALAHITERTKIVFLAIPNNPTGTVLSADAVERFQARLPGHVVLVLDLAYGEFLPPDELARLMAMAERLDTVIALRTFSKAYGLAALRVGWMLAPEWMLGGLNMLRGVGNVNAIAQAAAEAAVQDRAFVAEAVRQTGEERAFLAGILDRVGLAYVPGLGNFLLTRFPDAEGRRVEDFLARVMADHGIWLRPVGEPGFQGWCRIGIGTRAENHLLAEALDRFKRSD
ncbi:MAG: histidinol-phosphate transaminase [Hyphomicrobiales bacterium]